MIASVRDKRMVEYPRWIIVLTFLPLGWLVYYNSMVHADEDERRERLRRLMGDRQTFRVTGDFIDEYEYVYERDVTSFQKGSQFVPDPVFARQVYAELRDVEDRKSSYQLKLETAQREFEDNTDELRELAAKLQAAQVRRNEIAKDIQQHETTLSLEGSVDALHDQMVMAEFQSISMLKGVVGVRVFHGALSVLVKGEVEYDGVRYDKGDWELRIIPGQYEMWSHEVRSGVRKSWKKEYGRGEYPDYRNPQKDYCFGGIETHIEENIARGQYLQALELAVLCINSVNKEDYKHIPAALKRIEE